MGRSPTAKKAAPRDAVSKIAQQRLSVLELARELGNVAEACRQRGMDRTSFYEWKRRFQTQGFDGLKDLPPIHKSHPQTTTPETVEKIKTLALAHPAYGCNRHEAMLALEGIRVDFKSSEVNEATVRQLHRGEFMDNAENVVLIGGPGTGKSHVATAIGVQAIEHHRRKVRFYSTVELVNALEQEKLLGKTGKMAEMMTKIDLVILDELGYLPFSPSGGALLFHLLSKLYERTSVIITTNLSFAEWAQVRQPPKGCIHHTDRGSQYCSHDYQRLLRQRGFQVSMSGKGNCYYNSAVETFFKTIKAELIWRRSWQNRRQAGAAIFQYINGFYNPRRRHSVLGWKSPVAFERKVV